MLKEEHKLVHIYTVYNIYYRQNGVYGFVGVVETASVVFLIQYLAFSCGVVRGALCNLGLESVVTAEVSIMPSCKLCQTFTTFTLALCWCIKTVVCYEMELEGVTSFKMNN